MGTVPTTRAVAPGDGDGAPAALPVRLELDPPQAEPVRRWVEGVLGWQPIDTDTAALVPPAVSLVGTTALIEAARAPSGDVGERTPCVLVIADDAEPVVVARAAVGGRPDAVVGWPSGRDELSGIVADALAVPRRGVGRARLLRIGGAAGGVGTTVVTLAVAGLEGWRGRATVAAIRRPSREAASIETAALADADLWGRTSALPAVAGARLVHLADGQPPPEPRDPRVDTLVVDAGVDRDVDVLVCRRDAAALAALEDTTAAAVVVVGDGPVPVRELAARAGGRRGVTLPWSARVARADRHGRVPGGLPGAWLRRLLPLVPERVDTVERSTAVPA